MTQQHQQNRQEEQAIREQRSRDIDLYGFERAFRRDRQVMSFEKAEWLRKNNMLGEEM